MPVNSPGGVADVHGEVFHLTVDPRLPARVASFGIRGLRMQMNWLKLDSLYFETFIAHLL